MIANLESGKVISFLYKNYKGETAYRKAVFKIVQYGENEYHPNTQMFLGCVCLDKDAFRSFAIADISELKVLG